MKISTYEICNAEREEHLNGTIVLMRESSRSTEGIAVVYVRENSTTPHYSSAVIKKIGNNVWETQNGHRRPDGNIQHWTFKQLDQDSRNPDYHDNNKPYSNNNFLCYSFQTPKEQADGSGTAGNTGGGGF